MSTIREIARELNLSHTTVSRVLNTRNEHTISPPTRERVWETARRMGYQPHYAARALATGQTGQIGLLMRFLYSSFHAQIVQETEQTLRQSGYQVSIATMDWSRDEAEMQAPNFQQVDGYLTFETASRLNELLAHRKTVGKNVPLVAMGGDHLGNGPDQVGFDLAAGTNEAMAHLLATGRRRIVHVTDKRGGMRLERYRAAMEAAGLPPEILITPSQKRADARDAVYESVYRRLSEGTGIPDALFCFNDEIAIGAYRGLRDLGLRIPDDIAIVGFDGIEDAAYLDTPLTTVALPVAEMCASAWKLLQQRIADPASAASPCRLLLRPTLIVRGSTAISENPPRESAVVASARDSQ